TDSRSRRIRSGTVAVYVGTERARFVIPTRHLNYPVFLDLLNMAEEEYGFQVDGGLVLPIEPAPFEEIVRILEEGEERFRAIGLDEFLRFGSCEYGSCKELPSSCSNGFTVPLLPKTRV
ncbi:hypothetical protein M569_13800, partial [Genlisea aurea]